MTSDEALVASLNGNRSGAARQTQQSTDRQTSHSSATAGTKTTTTTPSTATPAEDLTLTSLEVVVYHGAGWEAGADVDGSRPQYWSLPTFTFRACSVLLLLFIW